MRRALLVVLLVPALLLPSAPPAHALSLTSIASAREFPAAMAFAPGGLLFYAERFTGEIRTRNVTTGADNHFFTIGSIATAGEQGLLGLAVHPQYPSTPYVFAYVTRLLTGGGVQNQVVRITASGGVGTSSVAIVRIVAGTIHNGGAMAFGPAGALHVVVGDVGNPSFAQDTVRMVGKVIRINSDGTPFTGNPFGNRVFSYGHRNMFGIARDPQTGRFWVTENGPECNDELNPIVNGGNFAWGPSQSCGSPPDAEDTNRDGPLPRLFPARLYNPVIAPTGAAFCSACGLGSTYEGTLLFGAWNTGEIRRVILTPDRKGASSSSVVLDHSSGLLAMARHPNGKIYVSDADQIFRLDP
jgi:glucose/arabinose dehydrogenase